MDKETFIEMIEIENSDLPKRAITFWRGIVKEVEEKLKVKVICYKYGAEVIVRIEALEIDFVTTLSFEAMNLKKEFILSNIKNAVYFELYRKVFRGD